MGFIHLAIRTVQILFAAIVIGLTADLVASMYYDTGVPAIISYALFCGIFGALAGIFGIVAFFIESLQGLVALVVDALATLFYLAGACALAAQLGVGSCGDPLYFRSNDLMIAGAYHDGRRVRHTKAYVQKRCRELQAADAFLFFALALAAASVVIDIMGSRRGGRASAV